MKRSGIAWVPWIIVKVTLPIIKTVIKGMFSSHGGHAPILETVADWLE